MEKIIPHLPVSNAAPRCIVLRILILALIGGAGAFMISCSDRRSRPSLPLNVIPPVPPVSAAPATGNQEVFVRGRVVDQAGNPVINGRIHVITGALGPNIDLSRSEALTAHSDEHGRFSIRLPYAGLRYRVGCEKQGYSDQSMTFVADRDQEVELRLDAIERTDSQITGFVRTETGEAAGDVALTLVGEYGISATTRTDADGAFTFGGLPSFGQGVVCANSHGKVLAIEIIYSLERQPFNLRFASPATFRGTALDKRSGQLLGDTVVTLRAMYVRDVRFQTTSDAQGNWQINDVPPGEYVVHSEAPDHFEEGRGADRDEYKAAPGETITVDPRLRRRAVAAGTVVDQSGKPVSGAIVCALDTWDYNRRDQYRWVTTDPQGHFELKTGHINEALTIEAAHGQYGPGRLTVKQLGEGGKIADLRIVLLGVVRVRGIVTDRNDKHLAHILCVASWNHNVGDFTDEQGRFDWGLVPPPPDARNSAILIKPPQTTRGESVWVEGKGFVPVPHDEAHGMIYYEPSRIAFTAKSGETVDLHCQLNETELLSLRGRIVDMAGKPLTGASAVAFAGNTYGWVDRVIITLNNSTMRAFYGRELGGCVVDIEGRFQLFVLRYEDDPVAAGTSYSIGIVSGNKARKLMTDVIVPLDKPGVELKIQVDPAVELNHDGLLAAPEKPKGNFIKDGMGELKLD